MKTAPILLKELIENVNNAGECASQFLIDQQNPNWMKLRAMLYKIKDAAMKIAMAENMRLR